MGKRSSKLSIEEESIEDLSPYYYYHIWKERLDWTKHFIPVRVKDPRSGFFMESYMEAPPNITDIHTQEMSIDISYMFIYKDRVIDVPLKDIYVTYRTMHKLNDKGNIELKIPGIVDVSDISKYLPPQVISDSEISRLLDFYKHSFTIHEIRSSLNNNTISEDMVKSKYRLAGKRSCLITSQILDTYASNIPSLNKKVDTTVTHNTLISLINQYKDCSLCTLGQKRIVRFSHLDNITTVTYPRLGKNNIDLVTSIPDKLICFIGEAPGIKEEQDNVTFHPKAPAGEILYKVITKADIDYNKCYFTNAVLCRPESNNSATQNGTPTVSDIKACNTRLKNELAIIKPKIVVLLGKTAYHSFFGNEPKSVKELTGWLNQDKTIYLVPHPSYIVRELSFSSDTNAVSIKRDYLQHFEEIRERFEI